MEKDIHIKTIAPRKSNIELLRILAIIMIIAHHIAVHSNFVFATDVISVNRLWIQFIQIGGKIGVNIFILISGYFLVTASAIKTSKVIKLWLQIFTYSAGIFLVFTLLGVQPLEIKSIPQNILPITFSRWWFASVYFVLYLISPYINKLLNSFNKKEYQRFLCLLFFCWCIIPTFLNSNLSSNQLLWFVFLYALAGYIRLYVDVTKFKSYKCILIAFIAIALTYLSAVILDILGLKISVFANHSTYFYEMQKLPILIAALMLFIGFANANIKYVPAINIVSSATFGVYLIHDNDYIRNLLWNTVFQNTSYKNSNILIPYTILQIIIVFVVCTMIELLRICLIEKLYIKPLDTLSKWINKALERFFEFGIFEISPKTK